VGEATAPDAPEREGYTFTGWDNSFENVIADITITAQWEIKSITITFESNGGNEIEPISQNYATAVSAPTAPNKTGYTFLYWCSDSDLTAEYQFTTMPAEDITLYAKYKINQYTATFKDYDNTTLGTSKVDYLTSATAPSDPSRTGYTFNGWDTAFSSMTADITVTATYTINKYTATFKDYDGTTVLGTSEVNYLTAATAPSDPSRAGYTFNGWDTDFSSMTADITVTATYTINQYTATFKDYDGSTVLGTSKVDYLTSATAPSDPTRTGYTFSSWDTDFSSMTADITVTATYTINQYTALFIDYESTILGSSTVDYLTSASAPANPSRTGYTFNGWDTDFSSMTSFGAILL
jgi:uncharacterized repeat protein (TIGR02543 family)